MDTPTTTAMTRTSPLTWAFTKINGLATRWS